MTTEIIAPEVKPEPIIRTVRVTIEKEIRVILDPERATPEFIAWWKDLLWEIDSVDQIAEYAARMAAEHGGYLAHDGIGLLSPSYANYPSEPDTKFDVLWENVETEIIENAPEEKTAVQS